VPLTYFEFGTLAALCAFDEAGLDYLVLEIGLGGRLDAVNAVEPDAGIITNVALDHCDWLGADVESIAREKAGILRADKPFVYADPAPAAAVIERAAKLRTDLRLPGRDYRFAVTADGNWRFSGRRRELPRLAPPSLAGAFQLQNAAGVLALIEALGEDALLDGDLIDEAWAALVLPGRLQVIQRRRRWILDVAHNPAAACAVAGALPSLGRGRRVTCLIGILDDKDVAGIFEPLSEFVDEWVAVTPQSGRAIAAHELARQIANLSGKPCEIAASIEQACRSLEAGDPSAADVLVIGSFMTVGPVLAWLERQAAVRTD
jgi:dihydrofolate synthase/folylpolyglutamate synthase